jgi:hypothetical protein
MCLAGLAKARCRFVIYAEAGNSLKDSCLGGDMLLHFASTMLQQKSSCSQQDKYWAKMAEIDKLLRPARPSRTQISAEDRLISSVD